MDILGLITARGGSKSIPHKNIALLAGRPLLAYTCDAARASRRLTRTVLDTDDPAIAEVGRACGVEVPFMRPAELARDDTLHIDVIRHALAWFQEHEGYRPEIVALLQPTSPLRRVEHIDAAVDLMITTGADTVVSVVEVPHRFNPSSVMRLGADGRLSPFLEGPLVLRRQDKPRVYARNGPAVLVMRWEVVESRRLYGDVVRPLEMSMADSVDIDDTDDLAMAEFWLQRRQTTVRE